MRDAAQWFEGVYACTSRAELIELLGQPRFALTGKNCARIHEDDTGWRATTYDRIEHFVHRGMEVDILFRDGRAVECISTPTNTALDWELMPSSPPLSHSYLRALRRLGLWKEEYSETWQRDRERGSKLDWKALEQLADDDRAQRQLRHARDAST